MQRSSSSLCKKLPLAGFCLRSDSRVPEFLTFDINRHADSKLRKRLLKSSAVQGKKEIILALKNLVPLSGLPTKLLKGLFKQGVEIIFTLLKLTFNLLLTLRCSRVPGFTGSRVSDL